MKQRVLLIKVDEGIYWSFRQFKAYSKSKNSADALVKLLEIANDYEFGEESTLTFNEIWEAKKK